MSQPVWSIHILWSRSYDLIFTVFSFTLFSVNSLPVIFFIGNIDEKMNVKKYQVGFDHDFNLITLINSQLTEQ